MEHKQAYNREQAALAGVGIILVGPKYAENIGAAARIAYNFGISHLVVVRDEPPDQEAMLKMATHKAAHLIHTMELHTEVGTAVAPYHLLVGTTARKGRRRIRKHTPREVMREVAPRLAGNRIGLMFGPESSGLTNRDLDYCHLTSTIPTADFSSLNLAQAVAIHCYELYTAAMDTTSPQLPDSEYANSHELEGMYRHIEEVLATVGFLKHNTHVYWMRNIRQFLNRVRLQKKESSLIRGICRKFLWYHENITDSGQKEGCLTGSAPENREGEKRPRENGPLLDKQQLSQ